jgi:hypothetical protein
MAGEQLPNYWVKCFSKTRKIDYYFNTKTLKSLWTIEEVLESEKKSDNEMIVLSGKSGSNNKPLIAKQKANKVDKLLKVDISKKKSIETLKEKISKTLKTNKLILKESKINKVKEQIVKVPISKIKISKNLTKIQTDDVIVCNENSKPSKRIETEDTEAMEVDIIENVRIYKNNKFKQFKIFILLDK